MKPFHRSSRQENLGKRNRRLQLERLEGRELYAADFEMGIEMVEAQPVTAPDQAVYDTSATSSNSADNRRLEHHDGGLTGAAAPAPNSFFPCLDVFSSPGGARPLISISTIDEPSNDVVGGGESQAISAVRPTDWRDYDRDGRSETFRVGRIQDGRVVEVHQDLDNDGYFEQAWFDDDGDGAWDYVWLDSNADGWTDWIWSPQEDANGDGRIQREEWRRVQRGPSLDVPGLTSQIGNSAEELLTTKVYPVGDLILPLRSAHGPGGGGPGGLNSSLSLGGGFGSGEM